MSESSRQPEMDYDRGGTQKNIYQASDVETVSCPLCRTADSDRIYTERKSLGVVKCRDCGLIYISPRLKAPEKIYWGEADKYFQEARLIFEGKRPHHRDPNYLKDLALLRRYKPSGSLLDVGTNMGFFLRLAKNNPWTVTGVEPSPSLSEMARKYFGLNVKTAFLEQAGFATESFDAVTMTDVFEHLPRPKESLDEVHRILKPEGILFVKVPNGLFNLLKLRLARLTGKLEDYEIFDSYEHVVHYSHLTLRKMIEARDFRIETIRIGRPIQLPVWHRHVGFYYQYPSPRCLDRKRQSLRTLFYWISRLEFLAKGGRAGHFAPNLIAIARKA